MSHSRDDGAAAGDGAAARLYLITPQRIENPAAFGERLAEALDGGPVACLQIRLKDVDDDTIRRTVEILLPIAHARSVPVLMNDRPDLALATGCDGVHVGQQDASYAEARAVLGGRAMIGVTCHDSRHLAIEAADAGADYVAFGAFFETGTKQVKSRATVEILEWWRDIAQVPCVAIGGITPENCLPLVEAGADFLAVAGGVWGHPDGPGAAVQAFEVALRGA